MSNIIEVLGKEKIKSRSRNLIKQSLLPNLIDIVKHLDYKLYVHDSIFSVPPKNVFTIILTVHGNNINYFKQSIESVLKQTSKKFELILVNHGCESKLSNLMNEYFISDNRIKLLIFKENLYDPYAKNPFDNRFSNILNAALFCSEGDYVYFLSFDDFLSKNYIEFMTNLFLENANCVVATPSVVSVNKTSRINIDRTEELSQLNKRPRYIDGVDLAISVIKNENLFVAPGGLCCYKTNLVLLNGGFDLMNDHSQIFKFSVLGDVGTNLEAILYWRHHNNQTNKANKRLGTIYYASFVNWTHHIEKLNLVKDLPKSYQYIFHQYAIGITHENTINCIKDTIFTGWKGIFNIFIQISRSAPKRYIAYFIFWLLITSPFLLYNRLPKNIKIHYKSLKNFFSSVSIKP